LPYIPVKLSAPEARLGIVNVMQYGVAVLL
jgi:hypothetical protein